MTWERVRRPGEGRGPVSCYRQQMEITATGQSFAEALTETLNQLAAFASRANATAEASLSIPLRARESTLNAIAEAMVAELVAEIEEGQQIGSVRIDGLMKRDGDYICWGYALAAPEVDVSAHRRFTVRDLHFSEEPGRNEIRFEVDAE
jgi:hypothetical protein